MGRGPRSASAAKRLKRWFWWSDGPPSTQARSRCGLACCDFHPGASHGWVSTRRAWISLYTPRREQGKRVVGSWVVTGKGGRDDCTRTVKDQHHSDNVRSIQYRVYFASPLINTTRPCAGTWVATHALGCFIDPAILEKNLQER